MKRSLQLALVLGAVVVCVVFATQGIRERLRPNLLKNPSFVLSPLREGNGWTAIEPAEAGSFSHGKSGDNGFAVVDTRNLASPERNPFTAHALGQGIEITGGSEKQFTLTGRVSRGAGDGVALVFLSVHGAYHRSRSEHYERGAPDGEWVAFQLTCSMDQMVEGVSVALGATDGTVALFDDLELIRGGPRGGELTRTAMSLAITMLALAVALSALEIFEMLRKAKQDV